MPVSFADIPSDMLLPLFYAEVTTAREPISSSLKLCLVGMMNKDAAYGEGTAVGNVPYLLSGTNADALFGRGSALSWAYQRARRVAPFAEIWGCAVPEHIDSFRSTGSFTFVRAGSATYKGTLRVYVAGRPISMSVNATDSVNVLASRLAQRINSADTPVKATVAGSKVTCTCRWAGYTGNYVRLTHVGPLGKAESQSTATTLAKSMVQIKGMSGGSGENDPRSCYAQLLDRPFDVFCLGAPGTGSFATAARDFMIQRWGPYHQLYGHMVSFHPGSFQGLYDAYEGFNDPHNTVLVTLQSIMPPWEWSAVLAANMIVHWSAPPELSRPLQTLELLGMHVGDDDDESFSKSERQQLLAIGLSTFHVDDDYTCRIDRVRTLRQANDFGDPDPSWGDAITMFQAMYFVRQMRAAIQGTFPRCALTNVPTGINGFTSPQQITQLVIHEYNRMATMGVVENPGLFAGYLVVERDTVDRNRVNILMRPDMVNQLRVVATLVETHLEIDPGAMAA